MLAFEHLAIHFDLSPGPATPGPSSRRNRVDLPEPLLPIKGRCRSCEKAQRYIVQRHHGAIAFADAAELERFQ